MSNFQGAGPPSGQQITSATRRNTSNLMKPAAKRSGKPVLAPVLSTGTANSEQEESKRNMRKQVVPRLKLLQPKPMNNTTKAAEASRASHPGQDPLAPSYETSQRCCADCKNDNFGAAATEAIHQDEPRQSQKRCLTCKSVRYAPSQREPEMLRSILSIEQPMFSRESMGSGLGPQAQAVLPQAPIKPAAISTRTISPVRRQSMPSQQSVFVRNSQTSIPDLGTTSSQDDQNVVISKPSAQKKHVVVHLTNKQGKSTRENVTSVNSALSGVPARVKKLKFIKVDPMKLVPQDSVTRIQSAQGSSSSQLKHTAIEAPRKNLKVAKSSVNSHQTINKTKSQAVVARISEGSFSFREISGSAGSASGLKYTPKQHQHTVRPYKEKQVAVSLKENPSITSEVPLQESLPQILLQSVNDEVRAEGEISAPESRYEENRKQPHMIPLPKKQMLGKDASGALVVLGSGGTTSGAKASGATNNKDSSNFNDTEEKLQHDAMPSVDDSGWFTSNPSAIQVGLTTPNKAIHLMKGDSMDGQSDALVVHHVRGMTSSTEVKQGQRRFHLEADGLEEDAPIIKRVPESGIGQKNIQKGRVRQLVLADALALSKNGSLPSERASEMTDEPLVSATNIHMQSLESLQSNNSTSSLKNVFSQSQKITNIAARYIKIQDGNPKTSFAQAEQQPGSVDRSLDELQFTRQRQVVTALDDKGTPRFSRQQQKMSDIEESKRRENVTEQQTLNGSAQKHQLRNAKPKSGLRSQRVLDDQLSNTQDENSISSVGQQKDVKSLIGILQRQAIKASNQNSIKLNRSTQSTNLSQHNSRQKTKIQLSKLSDNLYAASSTSQNQGALGTLPLTPNSTGNATLQGTGFGSGQSQQSRSFNIGLQQSMQSQSSKKKLATAKPSVVSKCKQQQQGLIKNTLTKALQHQRQAAPQSKPAHQLPEAQIIATKVQTSRSGGGSCAQSQRDKSGLKVLLSSANQKQVEQIKTKLGGLRNAENSQLSTTSQQEGKEATKAALSKKKNVQGGQNYALRGNQKSSHESQRHKLFQKQLSQTIKLTGISSGISPKASGDIPVEFGDTNNAGFFKFHAAKTANFSKASKAGIDSMGSDQHKSKNKGSNAAYSGMERLSEEPCEVRDSLVYLDNIEEKNLRMNQTPTVFKQQLTARTSDSPYRVEDTQPRADKIIKSLQKEEGLGPLPTSPKHNRLSTLPSVNTLKQIETLKLAIREEKATNRQVQEQKQHLLSSQQIPKTQVSNIMPSTLMRKQTSSPPHSPVNDEAFPKPGSPNSLGWHQADGQPFHLYQSRVPNEKLAESEIDEGEEDNISEMMNTMLQSTHRSTNNPVAQFNEQHPTQQIQGMSQMIVQQPATTLTQQSSRQVIQSQHSPGDRMGHAKKASYQQQRSRQPVPRLKKQVSKQTAQAHSINDWADAAQSYYGQLDRPSEEAKFLPHDLLRAESIQSMSNVIDIETSYRINAINKGNGPAIVNAVHTRNRVGEHLVGFEQTTRSRQSRPGTTRETRQLIYSQSARKLKELMEQKKRRNIFVAMLEDGLLRIVLQFLPIKYTLKLHQMLRMEPLKREDNLLAQFEQEFASYIDRYRCNEPNRGGQSSRLCRLITGYYLATLKVAPAEEDVYKKVAYQLRSGRQTIKHAQSEGGVGFEIEKDVERTFIDQQKFTELHRHGLSIVLRAIAKLEADIGYVQGLNFIVGNLLMQMEHRPPSEARRAALVVFSTFIKRLGIKDYYTEKMLGLKEAIFKLECLLYNEMPEVFLYLMEMNISVEYFASQWFLTLFQYDIEDVEQSSFIMLLALIFGQKVIFQIAFQLVVTIRSKLCLMSFEKALIYLKDFAGEPQYRTTAFLKEAMQNDRITDHLLTKLGVIYRKMCEKQLNGMPSLNQTPMAMRVKFLRGTQPGKVNIKVIWGSSSQQDFMSNSNSLASIQNFQVVPNPLSPSGYNQPEGRLSDDEDNESIPIVIEDVPEIMNTNRQNNLSYKMNDIINQSIEQKKKQMGPQSSSTGSKRPTQAHERKFSPQIVRTFLQPSNTVIEDLLETGGGGHSPAQNRQLRLNYPQALLQNPMAFKRAQQVAPMQQNQDVSINPFDTNEGDSVNVPALEEHCEGASGDMVQRRLFLASFDNSLDLMRPVSPSGQQLLEQEEVGVASEDVEGDDNTSHHHFQNKELFEHTQSKNLDRNLHRYQEESTVEMSRIDNEAEDGGTQAQMINTTRSRGLSYQRANKPLMGTPVIRLNEVQEAQQPMIDLMNKNGVTQLQRKQPELSGFAESQPIVQTRPRIVNQRPHFRGQTGNVSPTSTQMKHAGQLSVRDLEASKGDDAQFISEIDKDRDNHSDTDPNSTPKIQQLQLQSSASSVDFLGRSLKHLQGNFFAKVGSISPNNQHTKHQLNGLSSLFLKLKPQAARQLLLRQENSVNSSEESAQLDERLAIGGAREQLARPQTYRAKSIENKTEDGLRSASKEKRPSREPPLFTSPQTPYLKYQRQLQQKQKATQARHQPTNSAAVSQELAQPPSHRSPRAFQPTLKQPGSGRHRKTTTGTTFNSRAMHYPDGSSATYLPQESKDDSHSINRSSAKKPSHRQKKRFAEILNLEKLNFQKMPPQASAELQSNMATMKQTFVRQESDLPDSGPRIAQQPSENIPESEQKEQKVNNISLYGSTNPNNLKITKRRQDLQHRLLATKDGDYQVSHGSPQGPYEGVAQSPEGVEWDEDDMMVRSYRLPKIPITKQTGLLSKKNRKSGNQSKQLLQEKAVRQMMLAKEQVMKVDLEDSNSSTTLGDLVPTLKHHGSQEDLRLEQRRRQQQRTVQRYQQDLLHSKDKKLMGQLNQSLEESKNSGKVGNHGQVRREGSQANKRSLSQASGEFRVLKESKSHDKRTMLSRLTASGVIAASGVSRKKDQSLQNRQRLFHMAVGHQSADQYSQTSHDALDMENLQDMEEDNFADGKIPEANISNYNSHQSQSKLQAFQRQRGVQNYASNGSNALEETCIIKNSNNLFLRQELRNSKLPTLNDSYESTAQQHEQNLQSTQNQARQPAGAGGTKNEERTKSSSLLRHIQATALAAFTGAGQGHQQQPPQQTRQSMSRMMYGKTSLQRQSMQVQGHMGDKLYEDQAL